MQNNIENNMYTEEKNNCIQEFLNTIKLKLEKEKILVIDRFEENFAVCEDRNNKKIVNIEISKLPEQVKEEVEIQVKYEGYIKIEEEQVQKFKKMEDKKLSDDIDYSSIKGLSLEARQKLDKIKPLSIGQASRISGVSPSDINVLLIYLQLKK